MAKPDQNQVLRRLPIFAGVIAGFLLILNRFLTPELTESQARSDAVGVILYQAVVGAVPFDAATFNELLFKIVLETPPSMLAVAPDIDPSFVEIVEKAMARELSARYQTAAELKAALESWLGGTFAAAGRTVAAGTPALDVGAMTMGWAPRAPASLHAPGSR